MLHNLAAPSSGSSHAFWQTGWINEVQTPALSRRTNWVKNIQASSAQPNSQPAPQHMCHTDKKAEFQKAAPHLLSTGSTPWAGVRAPLSLRPNGTAISSLSSVPLVTLLSFSPRWSWKNNETRTEILLPSWKDIQKWLTTESHIPNTMQVISCSQKKRRMTFVRSVLRPSVHSWNVEAMWRFCGQIITEDTFTHLHATTMLKYFLLQTNLTLNSSHWMLHFKWSLHESNPAV